MYTLIRALSVLIRGNMLPNPFEVLGERFNIDLFGISIPMNPTVMLLFIEVIMHWITFKIVGLYYTKRTDSPAWGSFLYLLFYCAQIGLLQLMGIFAFTKVACVLITILYVTLHIGLLYLKNNRPFSQEV